MLKDFGMSRVLKSEAEKGKTKTNYGPIRWMVSETLFVDIICRHSTPFILFYVMLQAPESLRDLQYSTKSDVWSFGIVGEYAFRLNW
jgi:serine/threonine protein kinase